MPWRISTFCRGCALQERMNAEVIFEEKVLQVRMTVEDAGRTISAASRSCQLAAG